MLVDEHGNHIGLSPKRPQAASFDAMGKEIYNDPTTGIRIHAGNIFEGKTVKGGWNLIVVFRRMGPWILYMHGDKAKKVSLFEFVRAVENGEMIPRTIHEIDPGRLEMASIGLDAIANRRTAEETIMCMGEGAEERYNRGE